MTPSVGLLIIFILILVLSFEKAFPDTVTVSPFLSLMRMVIVSTLLLDIMMSLSPVLAQVPLPIGQTKAVCP